MLEWMFNNPSHIFWALLPGGIIFAWAIYKLVSLFLLRINNSTALVALSESQAYSIKNKLKASQRLEKYLETLSKHPSTLPILFYKYICSHKDFSNILSVFSYQEFQKFQGRKIWVWNPVLVLTLLFSLFVSIGYHTNVFSYGGGFWRGLSLPLIVAGFYLAIICILALYRQTVVAYKSKLLASLSETGAEFFKPLTKHYDEFVWGIVKLANPTNKQTSRIIKAILTEGMRYYAPTPKGKSSAVKKEAKKKEKVVEIKQENETPQSSVENINDVFEKFAEFDEQNGGTPPPPPALSKPIETKINDDNSIQLLKKYNELLVETNKAFNLTAHKTLEDSWKFNIQDSLLFNDVISQFGGEIVDIGSGGGAPAIPLKISFPNWNLTMVDSVNKRSSF